MRIIALLALCIAAVAAVPSNPQRIMGGSVTSINNYPSIAALLYSANLSTYRQACGGSILNNRSILTAAHCTIGDPANRWRTRVGSSYANSGGRVLNSASILNHPSYNSRTMDNDIAIIRVSGTITMSNTVRAGSIAGSNYNLGDQQIVWAAGWGTVSSGGAASEQLRHVQIWTVNQNTCAQRYSRIGTTITANMLCSGYLDIGGRDQCQGDSGGPLYHNGVIVGVCSFGNGCGQPNYPGVNARVSRYTTWVQNNA